MAGVGFKDGIITMDEPQAIYYAGQVINGSLKFDLTRSVSCLAINITYSGIARVGWMDTEEVEYDQEYESRNVEYNDREQIFYYSQNLLGGEGQTRLKAKTYFIPYQFQVPHTCPSSFEGEKGSIRYFITASLLFNEAGVENEEIVKKFKVVAPLDLNTCEENVREPLVLDFEEARGCGCFSAELITGKIKLPVRGYCPGQTIPITIETQNDTNVEITKIIFQITMKEKYRCRHPASDLITAEKVLASVQEGAVMSNSEGLYHCEMTVPHMIAANLRNCSIIRVKYFFKVIIKLSGWADDIEDSSEIRIGLVPLQEYANGYIHPMMDSLPVVPVPDSPQCAVNPEFVESNRYYPSPYGSTEDLKNPLPNQIGFRVPGMPLSPYPHPQPPVQSNPTYLPPDPESKNEKPSQIESSSSAPPMGS